MKNFRVENLFDTAEGMGINSKRTVEIAPKYLVKTDSRGIPTNVQGAYQPVNWKTHVAIIYMSTGELDIVPKKYLRKH